VTEGHECPAAGGEQIFLYDLKAATTRQLTTAVSGKSTPRISGKRIIWADGRNGADFDVWSFDLSTNLEDILAGGAGTRFPGDISGNRLRLDRRQRRQ
jgi:beta propeller repeat protein